MVNSNYLELKNINFSYKKNNLIIKNLNIKFLSGQITALLGINGSGKTTLFKILTGIYKPENGEITYNNTQITSKNIIDFKSTLGFMPELLYLYKNMNVRDVLTLLGSLKGFNNFDLNKILKTVFLLEHCKKKIKALSKGMKQRLNLAQAIIGSPRVILFDEPSNGFDCGSITMFYNVLRNLANNGAIVLISSHHLTEIYGNVDKVLILSNGKILQELDINITNNNIMCKELFILLDNSLDINTASTINKKFTSVEIKNNGYIITGKTNMETIFHIIKLLIELNINIKDIKITEKILENILISLS